MYPGKEKTTDNQEKQQRLYELNLAAAAWHEAVGENIAKEQKRFLDALQWFTDRNIGVHTEPDATFRGIYVFDKQE